MIDTWLAAAVLLALLALGALVRLVRARNRNDRFLAALLAVTFGAFAGLMAGIGQGTLAVIDITLVSTLICSAALVAYARVSGSDRA